MVEEPWVELSGDGEEPAARHSQRLYLSRNQRGVHMYRRRSTLLAARPVMRAVDDDEGGILAPQRLAVGVPTNYWSARSVLRACRQLHVLHVHTSAFGEVCAIQKTPCNFRGRLCCAQPLPWLHCFRLGLHARRLHSNPRPRPSWWRVVRSKRLTTGSFLWRTPCFHRPLRNGAAWIVTSRS